MVYARKQGKSSHSDLALLNTVPCDLRKVTLLVASLLICKKKSLMCLLHRIDSPHGYRLQLLYRCRIFTLRNHSLLKHQKKKNHTCSSLEFSKVAFEVVFPSDSVQIV